MKLYTVEEQTWTQDGDPEGWNVKLNKGKVSAWSDKSIPQRDIDALNAKNEIIQREIFQKAHDRWTMRVKAVKILKEHGIELSELLNWGNHEPQWEDWQYTQYRVGEIEVL